MGWDEIVIAHGVIYRPERWKGSSCSMVTAEWVGSRLLTLFQGDDCEIVSLDSLREGQGIGSKLIKAIVGKREQHSCKRLFLITTNDNLNALGFYQKRGFEIGGRLPRRRE